MPYRYWTDENEGRTFGIIKQKMVIPELKN